MVIEFLVWALPILAFFSLSWLHIYGVIYSDGTAKSAALWSLLISSVATALAGFVYFIFITLFVFGYDQGQSFKLQDLDPVDKGKTYVGQVNEGSTQLFVIRSGGKELVLNKNNSTIKTKEGGKPIAMCERFATKFPKALNGGPFDDISFASRCTITVPSDTIDYTFKRAEGYRG